MHPPVTAVSRSPDPAPGSPDVYRFRFHGRGGELFVLLLKNILLTIVTLGIYAAWAKTERRRYIWSRLEMHDQRLLYTGTGKELLIGYLKVAAFYLVFFGLTAVAGALAGKNAQAWVQGLFGLAIFALVPFAIYWSRAYLLSRTQWRGIRFGLIRGAGPYAKTFYLGYLATIFTLGVYGPFWSTNMRRMMTTRTRFGSEPFGYDGVGKEVFWICAKGLILSICTLGVYSFWWKAELTRYHLAHTTFSGARGRSSLTGGDLLVLFLINFFGTALTLGIAFPWLTVYTLREVCDRILFAGPIDFAAISRGAAVGSASGDALADALDVGLGI